MTTQGHFLSSFPVASAFLGCWPNISALGAGAPQRLLSEDAGSKAISLHLCFAALEHHQHLKNQLTLGHWMSLNIRS